MSFSSLASCNSDVATSTAELSSSNNVECCTFDKCPRCRAQFDFHKRANISKVPLILTCKHTVCEDCIRGICISNLPVCPVCREKIIVPRGQLDSLSEIFQPHFSLIGQLVWAKNIPYKKQLSFVSTGQTLAHRRRASGNFAEINFDFKENLGSEGDDNDFKQSALTLLFDKCSDHSDQYLNIQCENCNNTFCCYCFLEHHVGHKAIYLYKLTQDERTELEKLKSNAEIIRAQLLATKKKVGELKTFDLSDVETGIKKYFSDLHAKLHLTERNLRKQLLDLESGEVDLGDLNANLQSGLFRINHLLNNFKLIDSKKINLRALYEEAQGIADVPCRLVSDQKSSRPIEFHTDGALDNIEDNFKLKYVPSIRFSLEPIKNWDAVEEYYEFESMRTQSRHQVPVELSENKAVPFNTVKNETEEKNLNDMNIRVIVTHINHLNSFFIQKYSTLDSLKAMNYNIGRKGRRRNCTEDFKIGGIYGVFYETRNLNQWRRGKLLDIINSVPNEPRYKMYYLDYGSTQVVTKEKLKELDLRSVRRQPFAQECKLTNPENINFDPNAHMYLPQIIGDKAVYLRYVDKRSDKKCVQEVDLLVTSFNSSLISVRDLLSKPTVAEFHSNNNQAFSSKFKFFKNSKSFVVSREEKVYVTYIQDPFHVYVTLVENAKIIEKMKNDMEKFYRDRPSTSYIPVEGDDVVVNFVDNVQGNWHRAKITSVDNTAKLVDVFFVDWGFSAILPWACLRKLTENFIKVECQAITVKLAHIDKVNLNASWLRDAVNFLREQICSDEVCKMVISSEDPLQVVLFQARPSADICLNSLLVKHNYALSTGNLSQTLHWPHMIDVQKLDDEEDDMSFKMVKKSEEFLIDDDEDVHLKSGLRLPITILSYKTPDLIYFRFKKDNEKVEELHKYLQIHYNSRQRSTTKNKWKKGAKCVVFDSTRRCYCRAIIKAPSGADSYLVYVYDDARELEVSQNAIYIQDPYFNSFRCLAYKCSLSLIKPAGGVSTWPSIAVEMVEKIFTKYKSIYIKKIEECPENKLIGVIMWYCLTTPAKALEPSKRKLISINKTLIQSGVALNAQPSLKEESKPVVSHDDIEWIDNDNAKMKEENLEDEKTQDCDDTICQNEVFHISQKSWPKMVKTDKDDFDAILTCVDTGGYFYVRDESMHSLYLDMEANLTQKMNTVERLSDLDWSAGDMCTIFYDDRWYRGIVLELLDDDVVSVEMIDFGSEHVVSKEDLSKYIMFPDCPPLVYKFQLYDVHSKHGQWSSDDVSKLLEIVTDNVRIVIRGDKNRPVPYAEVYLENGSSVNDLITTKCPHMKRYEAQVILGGVASSGEDTEVSTSKNERVETYTTVPLPYSFNGLPEVFIVNILRLEDHSYNVVISYNDNNFSHELEKLSEDMLKKIGEQPPLKNLIVNKPCVCYHNGRKIWGRALIRSLESLKYDFVLVFFVDYGTLDMIALSKVKEMRPEWFKLPVHMRVASVNFELVQSNQSEFVMMQLNQLRGKYVQIETVSEDPLRVNLWNGKNLCYEDLINRGVIKVCELE